MMCKRDRHQRLIAKLNAEWCQSAFSHQVEGKGKRRGESGVIGIKFSGLATRDAIQQVTKCGKY